MLPLSLPSRPLHRAPTWVWDYADSFIFIILVKYKTNKLHIRRFCLFFFLYRCQFCMNQREVKCQHKQMRPVLPQHRCWTLTWRIAPLTPSLPLSFSVVSTWTINQTASCDWWQSVRNELLWLGLSCAGRHEAGGVWKSQRKGRESVNAELNRIRGGDINIQTWRTVSGERHWGSQTWFKWTKGSVGISAYIDFTENLSLINQEATLISEKHCAEWKSVENMEQQESKLRAKIKIKALDFSLFCSITHLWLHHVVTFDHSLMF